MNKMGINAEKYILQIFDLNQEIETLKDDQEDLKILLETITEHSTDLENEIYEKNQIMIKYLQQVEIITTAAAAVEAGTFEINSLDEISQRTDELGQLSRVFQNMVIQIKVREENLRKQVAELKIEIDQKKQARQVAEIIQTDSFQSLKHKLQKLKQIKNDTKHFA
ncbi:histidine kinase [Aphanothece hegewaldii CCALA 016]|uniref:Histidine kinase n=2 Tax=Aphanothece TaxID=1121 RepID=A0A2T1M3P1_9CHRO|nr:histidine kinase [Aphanothece hegewaldii CCALA 016]